MSIRNALALAAAALAFGGAAQAQPAAPPAKPAEPGSTVSGIVVQALPKKSCSSRDKECIALVVANLKQNYPEQLKAFCFQWKTQALRSEWVNDQLIESLGGATPPTPAAFGVNSAVAQACAEDKPARK
ncbi:MAG TPA: hypothetical protein VNW53_05650 [Phenylobacterium sp.]|jgi:hypothetical protein|uniref:hypothetical protein n=1 Tax=Phenylobacterium sp. TaxID=1871053 RepID=UPI002BE394E7|nr:hypothetical protein [Phenylobacterium sp.]HXA38465.1 hypothetical protein [Phenylobacterium sp.]